MIGATRNVAVWAFGAPCDMRKAYDALSALVEQGMHKNVLSGDLYLFVNKTRRRAKYLYFDGTGLCLFAKRLELGRFAPVWQRSTDGGPVRLTTTELALFLEGSELVGRLALSPEAVRPGCVFAEKRR